MVGNLFCKTNIYEDGCRRDARYETRCGWRKMYDATRDVLETFKHQFAFGFVAFKDRMGTFQRGSINFAQSLCCG